MSEIKTKIQKRDARGTVRHGADWLQLWAHPDDDLTELERAQKRQGLQAFEREKRSLEHLAKPLASDPKHVHKLSQARADWSRKDWAVARGQVARTAFLAQQGLGLAGLGEALDLARATALGLRRFPGLLTAMQALALDELERSGSGHAFLAAQLPLDKALFLVFTDRWAQAPQPLFDSGAVDMWLGWFVRNQSVELAALDAALLDPPAFRAAVEAFLTALRARLAAQSSDSQTAEGDAPQEGGEGAVEQALTRLAKQAFHEAIEGELAPKPDEAPELALPSEAPQLLPFRTEFDQTLPLSALINAEQIEQHRLRLATRYPGQSADARRLAQAFALALRARRQSNWVFDREEGLVDASRLAQVIAAPQKRRLFKQEVASQELDAAVTLLVDCSGSMRGKWMDLAVLALRALGDALNLGAIPFEVLGFTTTSTRGGQSFAAWKAEGSPLPEPGTVWRLNDLRHLVLKSFGQPWRQPRKSLPGLCEGSLLNENLDHESLVWAAQRLRAMPQQRKVLLVVSDGAPSCGTTERFAAPDALTLALSKAVAGLDDLEICGLGIRHDVSALYPRSVLIERQDALMPALFTLARGALLKQ